MTAIARVSAAAGWVLTDQRILYTGDRGATWQSAAIPTLPLTRFSNRLPEEQFFVDGTQAWVAVPGPAVTVTSISAPAMAHRSVSIPMPAPAADAALDFLTPSHGWLDVTFESQGPSRLYVTDDGGLSWRLLDGNSSAWGPIHFTSAQVGWAVQNPLLKTTDGGLSWQPQEVPIKFSFDVGGGFDALSMFGTRGVLQAEVGTGMSSSAEFAVTANGGTTWTALGQADPGISHNNTGIPESFSAVDAQHWRASSFDKVYATDDGGRHWAPEVTTTFEPIDELSFATPDDGWAFALEPAFCSPGSTCASVLEATSDGGHTWSPVPLPPS